MSKNRIEDFKVGDYVQILDVDCILGGFQHWRAGEIVKVESIGAFGNIYLKSNKYSNYSDYENCISQDEIDYIKLVKKEEETSEIEFLINKINKMYVELLSLKDSIKNIENHIVPQKEIRYEDEPFAFKEDIPQKTNNQLRKELIEEAKVFTELDKYRDEDGYLSIKDSRSFDYSSWVVTDIDFKYNYKKRNVLLRVYANDSDGKTIHIADRHVAQCHPNEVFNAHIGKAIVLGRALGLDVTKFENAVQPDEFVEGQYVVNNEDSTLGFSIKKIECEENISLKVLFGANKKKYDYDYNLKIEGDTRAKY